MARIGILIADFRTPDGPVDLFERVAAAARAADEAGFDSLSLMDHVHQHPPYWKRTDPMPEAYVLLGALAACTKRIRLGTLVTGATLRNPALLAKMVTTLDVVSGGRAFLGIGASWNEDSYRAYGYGEVLSPIGERLDRLEEAVHICRALFRAEEASFSGRHHTIAGALNVPQPLQPGGPPILIGGGGEKRLLRFVARHADISNILGDPQTLRHKLEVLARHCEEVGRDPAELLKTHTCMAIVCATSAEAERRALAIWRGSGLDEETFRGKCIAGDPDTVAEQAADRLALGLDGLMFFTDRLWTDEDIALTAEAASRMGAELSSSV